MACNLGGVILLVDNDENLKISNRGVLERQKFTVHTATTFAEARQQIAAAKPDIIIMETILSDGDGYTFCREIRDNTSAYIILLAKAGAGDAVRGYKSGIDVFIEKPLCQPELLARVDTAMRRIKMGKC